MQITRLNIERVRNLRTVALHGLQPFNVFYGQNGSGTTDSGVNMRQLKRRHHQAIAECKRRPVELAPEFTLWQ